MTIESLNDNTRYIQYTKSIHIHCSINPGLIEYIGSRLEVTSDKHVSESWGSDIKANGTSPNAKYYNYKNKMLVIWQLYENKSSNEDPSISIHITYIYLKDSRSIVKDIEMKASEYADEKYIEAYGNIDPMELMDPDEQADMCDYTDTVYIAKREELLMEFMEKQLDSNLESDTRKFPIGLLWI